MVTRLFLLVEFSACLRACVRARPDKVVSLSGKRLQMVKAFEYNNFEGFLGLWGIEGHGAWGG